MRFDACNDHQRPLPFVMADQVILQRRILPAGEGQLFEHRHVADLRCKSRYGVTQSLGILFRDGDWNL